MQELQAQWTGKFGARRLHRRDRQNTLRTGEWSVGRSGSSNCGSGGGRTAYASNIPIRSPRHLPRKLEKTILSPRDAKKAQVKLFFFCVLYLFCFVLFCFVLFFFFFCGEQECASAAW